MLYPQSVVVIGSAAVDIQGAPQEALAWKDSNPGRICLTLGGVGRNIAENLTRLRVPTELVTAMGKDIFSDLICRQAQELGIGLSHSLWCEDASSSTFLYVNEIDGDLALAIADMDIVERLDPAYLKKIDPLLRQASAIVLETDMTQEAIEYMVDNYRHIPLFGDTVAVLKAHRMAGCLGGFHTLKPNQYEAEYLSDTPIRDMRSLNTALDYFLNQGVQQVFITLGKEGAYYGTPQERGFMMAPCNAPVNTLGAGDAFLSACVEGFVAGRPIAQTTHRAMLAAYLTLLSVHTVSPEISLERIATLEHELPPQIAQEVSFL